MVKAVLKNHRQSPRKVRLVADIVRGKNVGAALTTLMFTPKKAALSVKKVIESAVANAKHNSNLDERDLFIKEISVDEGLTMKRWRARARGRANRIRKRTSHIMVTLATRDGKEIKAEATEVLEEAPKTEKKASATKSATAKKTTTAKKAAPKKTVKKESK